MRRIGLALLVLALLAGAGLWYAARSLNGWVRAAVVAYGPELLGAPVRLESVQLSPLSGAGRLSGLVIGNPKGFQTPSAFELGEVRVALDPRSLLGEPVVVREIVVRAPRVTYEAALGGSNISAILKNVERYSGGPSPKGGQTAGPAKRVRIERFVLEEGTVTLSAKGLKGKSAVVPLPDVRLEGIGGARGVPPERAGQAVMKAVLAAVAKAAAASPESAWEQGRKAFEGAGKRLKGIFKK